MPEERNDEVKEKSGFDFKIILIGLLIFLVAMGASYFMLKSLIAPFMPEEEKKGTKELTANLVSAGEFTTNINDPAGNRFVKVEVYIEVEDKKKVEEINKFMPVIKDTILSILSSKTATDLDVRYREKLKAEIKDRLNQKLGEEIILNVYFTSFIMQ
ncbi:MAG: flagellar basal body-associated FliL family protein [Thermosyntropha sp.]|nr:flagellar basal body-associated FliL family protein [Thermosyntropha sp.]